MKERENNGYCFIKGRIKPTHILQALRNIPYELLPPTLKKVDDFISNFNLKQSYHSAPSLKVDKALRESAKKKVELFKKMELEDPFEGTIPYVPDYYKCDFGQKSIDMAKDIKIRELYMGIEEGLYNFSSLIRNIEPFINEKGNDLIKDKHPVYKSYPKDEVDYYHSDITKLASEIYNNIHNDFKTDEYKDAQETVNRVYDDYIHAPKGTDLEKDLHQDFETAKQNRERIHKETKDKFKKDIHNHWINHWYDKYAWDFDEEERKGLKNPYLSK